MLCDPNSALRCASLPLPPGIVKAAFTESCGCDDAAFGRLPALHVGLARTMNNDRAHVANDRKVRIAAHQQRQKPLAINCGANTVNLVGDKTAVALSEAGVRALKDGCADSLSVLELIRFSNSLAIDLQLFLQKITEHVGKRPVSLPCRA